MCDGKHAYAERTEKGERESTSREWLANTLDERLMSWRDTGQKIKLGPDAGGMLVERRICML